MGLNSQTTCKGLSDTNLLTNSKNWHPRLESLDRMITEFPYMYSLLRKNWTGTHLMAVGLAILGSIAGAWDLGVGELSSGGDYNTMGINPFNPDSGICFKQTSQEYSSLY